jgi:hypothetical protein
MINTYQTAVKAAIHVSLLILTVLYLVSGLGITQYQIIGPLTLGFLTRNLAFRIHDYLLIPFVTLLGIHVLIGPTIWIYTRLKNRQPPRY